MLKAKFDRLVREQTVVAQKVLAIVPITQLWTKEQVYAEIRRQGMGMEAMVSTACLGALHHAGLIKKVGDAYRRCDVAYPKAKEPVVIEPEPTAQEKESMTSQIAQKLAPIAAKINRSPADTIRILVTRMQQQLQGEFEELAIELHDFAQTYDADQEKARADLEKFEQLRSLLKGLG